MIMADPNRMAVIKQRFPDLASAIERNDTG
jgi:hypothetical protein